MSAIALSPATAHYREAFERLQPALGGSAARRAAAMERFAELGFPGAREEAWKYTSLRRLESRRFVPAAPTTAAGRRAGGVRRAATRARQWFAGGQPCRRRSAALRSAR